MSVDIAAVREALAKAKRLKQVLEVCVVSKRCVYLNDYRIAGNKPWHAENLPQHSLLTDRPSVIAALADPSISNAPQWLSALCDEVEQLRAALAKGSDHG